MGAVNKSFQDKMMLFFVLYVLGIGSLLYILGKVHIIPMIPQSIFCIIPISIICMNAHRFFTRTDILVLLFFSYIVFYSLWNFSDFELSVGTPRAITVVLFESFYPFLLFVFFRQPGLWKLIVDNKKVITAAWVFLSAAYFALALWGMKLVGASGGLMSISLRHLSKYLLESGELKFDVGYQAIGDSYVFFTLLLLCLYRSVIVRMLVVGASLYILYIVGSRASFVFLALTILIVKIVRLNIIKSEIVAVLLFMFTLCTAVAFNTVNNYNLTGASSDPMMKLMVGAVFDPDKDESYVARKELSARNTDILIKSNFLGDYRFEVKEGRPGTYTHNVVSVLEEYGIFAFAVILFMYAAGLLQIMSQQKSENSVIKYALCAMIFLGTSMFFARSYDTIIYWLGISFGIVSAASSLKTEGNPQLTESSIYD